MLLVEVAMKARDIMTCEVATIGPDTPVTEIARLLLERRISGVPVVDAHGKLLGIVSEGDLIRRAETGTEIRRSWWLQLLADNAVLAGEYAKAHGRTAEEIMTRDVVTVTETTPVAEIAALLERHHVKRVPVVHRGKIVGIISRANLLHALAATEVPVITTANDEILRTKVAAEIDKQPWATLSARNIVVKDGIVHLWGLARSEEEVKALRVAAETVPGVRAVKNHVTVAAYSPAL
jgi:CBS domain-containing protein